MTALQRALPYIRLYRNRVFVIKAGGALCEEPAAMKVLAEQLCILRELGIRLVLVHGGGPQTTELPRAWGSKPPWLTAAASRAKRHSKPSS